ncbi:MAG: iron-sulfur cluster assembly protein [Fimbriimonadaceae bacterium]
MEAIRTVYDPELPVNVYDLGLIYGIHINQDRTVELTMTLTSPACPVAEHFLEKWKKQCGRFQV